VSKDSTQPPHATPANHERVLVRIVSEAARELGARVDVLGEGWVLRITRDSTHDSMKPAPVIRHIHGYSFDLNPAATHQICCDKAATSEVLTSASLACVPHQLFLHPDMAKFVPHRGTWEGLLTSWRGWNCDAVVKENEGTGGRGVSRCRSVVELEQAVYRLFERTQSVALCPYVEIEREVRFIMLRGTCETAYEKVRACVVGDGRSSLLALMITHPSLSGMSKSALLENLEERERAGLARVPREGERVALNWRHNLGQGASARLLSDQESRSLPAWDLAHEAARALGLAFGSVDVVEVAKADNAERTDLPGTARRWRVLEVNSGVMMEFLARSSTEGLSAARSVYSKALRTMLDG
jgi:glutathione synthase/RimK-type ligase-like ATP-grasp enzyme